MNTHRNHDFFEEIIKYAAARSADEISAQYPDSAVSQHEFSEKFNSQMEKFLKAQKRKAQASRFRKRALKVCIGVFALLIVAGVTIYSVDAFRDPVMNLLKEPTQESVNYYGYNENANYARFKSDIHDMYLPQYIPDGFKVAGIHRPGKSYTVSFQSNDGRNYTFNNITGNMAVDNEGVTKEEVMVNGEKADYIIQDEGKNMLIFSYNKNKFYLSGGLDKAELLKIAQSLDYYK